MWDGLALHLADKLQKLQSRSTRAVTNSGYDIGSHDLLEMLELDRVSVKKVKQKAVIVYKNLNNQAPSYLNTIFNEREGTCM